MSLSKRLINTGGGAAAGPSFYGMRYTGNNSGTYRNFTGFGFKPDIIWIKGDALAKHVIQTSLNFGVHLVTSSSSGYDTATGSAYAIEDGIAVGGINASAFNYSGVNYDVYAWKAGGSTYVTNTNGTITSQVSANVPNGISIVTWTGNGIDNATIGHGLSSAPELIIVKKTSSNSNWVIGGTQVGANSYLTFQYTQAISGGRFKTINDTTFQVDSNSDINATSSSYIAYCFHSVEGFSKIGSVDTGNVNGSVTGLSFAPKYFLGRSKNCSFPFYMKNIYQSDYLYTLNTLDASNRGPGLRLNADSFDYYVYFNNHLRCGTLFYALFGSDLM